jgi:excisionase family DNA binding protein
MTNEKLIMPEHSLPTLFTIKQTAKQINVSSKTIRRWIDTGDLVAHRIGHQFRISEPDLQIFIRLHREG